MGREDEKAGRKIYETFLIKVCIGRGLAKTGRRSDYGAETVDIASGAWKQ